MYKRCQSACTGKSFPFRGMKFPSQNGPENDKRGNYPLNAISTIFINTNLALHFPITKGYFLANGKGLINYTIESY